MLLRDHKAQSISVPRHLAQHVHKSWIQYQGHWPWGLSVVPWDTWNWQKRREKNTPNETRKHQPQLLQLSSENTQLHRGNGNFSQINRSLLTALLHIRSQVTMNVSLATTTACGKLLFTQSTVRIMFELLYNIHIIYIYIFLISIYINKESISIQGSLVVILPVYGV